MPANKPRVKECRIIPSAATTKKRGEPTHDGADDYSARVMIKLDDGSSEQLAFSYYEDELSFAPNEFIGLTVDDCLELHRKKDVAYLQS